MAARTGQQLRRDLAPISGALAVVFALAGCVQTPGADAGRDLPPTSAAIATSDPLVLSGVAYTEGDAVTQANASAPPQPNADIVAPAAAAPPAPVVSATPLPSAVAVPPVAPAGATPSVASSAVPSAATSAETAEYPNINIPPKQPGGKLLTPEERAKLIQELNALAGRPSAGQ